MRLTIILLLLVLINTVISAEPGVINFPQENSLIRVKADFIVNQGEVNASAGVKVIGGASNLTITVYPSNGLISFHRVTLNNQLINYSLTKGDGYYLFEPNSNFTNGDIIILDFNASLRFGTHSIIIDFVSLESTHRIESAIIVNQGFKPLIINQSVWSQFNARVGKQVGWVSIVNVFNPNELPVYSLINASLLPDSFNVQLISDYKNQSISTDELKVYWHDNLNEFEIKRYVVSLSTPPVVEGAQSLTIMDSSGDNFLMRNNVSLINLAGISYNNISYDFNIPWSNVTNVYCADCYWYDLNGLLRIVFNNINSKSTVNTLINYFDKPPLLSVSTNSRLFNSNSSVELLINLIPERLIKGLNLEVLVLAPDGGEVFADLVSYDEALPGELLNTSLKFNLFNSPEGNYSVIVNAREGLRLIINSRSWFSVASASSLTANWLSVMVILIVVIVITLKLRKP